MSDDNKPKLGMRAPLGLNKAVEVGKVKQSFSHGRTKQVVVEVKRARVLHRPAIRRQWKRRHRHLLRPPPPRQRPLRRSSARLNRRRWPRPSRRHLLLRRRPLLSKHPCRRPNPRARCRRR
jgi:Bacterial translation initiation factor IF-2 associated region